MKTSKRQLTGAREVSEAILHYLRGCQNLTAGEYFGAFWSEKAYHGPALDYHAGGSHHHRTAGSAGLALWRAGVERGDAELRHHAEFAFDWLVARQTERGGYQEIQNNEKPSDWEHTGLSECSTISTAFVAHGLAHALLEGLPPKKSYLDCLQKAAMWQVALEWPAGSGVFPHHERSPYDTLNANLHAAETCMAAYTAIKRVYGRPLNLLLQAALRAINHTLPLQWDNGCYPYRSTHGVTLNYTAVVMWCMLNIRDLGAISGEPHEQPVNQAAEASLQKAAAFLIAGIRPDGRLDWEKYESSTARHNIWAYLICLNVLLRVGSAEACDAADRIWGFVRSLRTPGGLLPMRDEGEVITRCAYMQADMLNFLWSHREA